MVAKTFDPCCGCIKLRTGCLIIGYFRLVVEITLDSYMAWMMIPSWIEEVSGLSGGFKFFLTLVGVLIMLFLAQSILACILFLVGLHKNQHELVAWYVIHARRCIFITLVLCIHKLFWPQDFAPFRNGFILLLLQGYFLLVIHCYCESMGQKPQPATTAAPPAPAPVPVPVPVPVPTPVSPPVPHRRSDAK